MGVPASAVSAGNEPGRGDPFHAGLVGVVRSGVGGPDGGDGRVRDGPRAGRVRGGRPPHEGTPRPHVRASRGGRLGADGQPCEGVVERVECDSVGQTAGGRSRRDP